jgi:hypothetical protein
MAVPPIFRSMRQEIMRLAIGVAAVFSVACQPLWAKPRPALPDVPNMVQWKDITSSMADLVAQGYSLVSTIAAGDQDEITTYFLSKGTELVRCRDGVTLGNNRGFVASCARLVPPYRLEQ